MPLDMMINYFEALVVLVGVLYKDHWSLAGKLVLGFVRRASASG